MPGVDNKLNVLPENSYYAVRADGEVVMENSSEVAKRIKGESHNSNAADSSRGLAIYVPASHRGIHVNGDFINSTLDPANGALLVNVGEK